jgi:uncharacterized membrane protein (UPF0127 family)
MIPQPVSGGAKLRGFVLLLALISPLFASCDEKPSTTQPQSNLRTITMQIGRQTFTLEVADTEPTRETGLMNRDSMPANHGMIFVFEDEEERGFYMKNTRFPLDILFIDGNGKVVSSKSMKPYDLRTTPSDAPAKYAIELNAGAAQSSGVSVGDQLNIPLAAQSAASTTTPTK